MNGSLLSSPTPIQQKTGGTSPGRLGSCLETWTIHSRGAYGTECSDDIGKAGCMEFPFLHPTHKKSMLSLTGCQTLDSVFPEAVCLATQTGGVSLDNHSLVRRIARAEFAQKYPEATARLLIHLGSMTKEQNRWMWYAEKGLFDDLLQQELPQDVKTGLRELMAELGLT